MYIVFEGIEGSGKSLQIKLLKDFLELNCIDFIITKEPGSTKIGMEIREILLSSKNKEMSYLTELFLYNADRAQHFEEVIIPNYGKKVIVSDRSFFSTFAYQGYGRGISFKLLENLNKISTKDISPDLVILLDCEPEIGIKRALIREETLENARFELEDIEFHKRVREGYLKLANEKNWLICNATLSPEKINNQIINYLKNDRNFKNFIKK